MEKITLYYFPKSSCSKKVTWVLEEKKLIYDEVIIDLENGEQKRNDYFKIHPFGQVPALKFGDTILYESSIINEFLDEQFPAPSLKLSSPIQNNKMRVCIHYADYYFYPCISKILQEYRKPIDKRNNFSLEELESQFHNQHLPVLESYLSSENLYIFQKLTLADFAFAPGLDTLQKVTDIDLIKFPKILTWLDQIKKVESFRRVSGV